MKIIILGAGFTGLTAAYKLLQQGHEVKVLEKDEEPGGLAGGFKEKGWDWTLEKAYHHWFTNDYSALNLAKEIKHPVITIRPQTNVFVNNQIIPLDSPVSLLQFSPLPFIDRLRTGIALLFLKLSQPKWLTGQKALPWLRKSVGKKSVSLIWEPLFSGKFGKFKEEIALIWFWARIKKRTPSLSYPEKGFMAFAQHLAEEVRKLNGDVLYNTTVKSIKQTPDGVVVGTDQRVFTADKVIATLPTPIFTKVTADLPSEYVKRINSIDHLSALNLILVFDKPFMGSTYWLNVTNSEFPFLIMAEHTNFMASKHYGNQHILYIGNYLPPDHPYLKMTAEELLKIFDPYLKQINPSYQASLLSYHLFSAPFAQPIVTTDYQKLIPQFKTPIKNVYLANMDMVYPWDRGTNYAIEMGEKIAELVTKD